MHTFDDYCSDVFSLNLQTCDFRGLVIFQIVPSSLPTALERMCFPHSWHPLGPSLSCSLAQALSIPYAEDVKRPWLSIQRVQPLAVMSTHSVQAKS